MYYYKPSLEHLSDRAVRLYMLRRGHGLHGGVAVSSVATPGILVPAGPTSLKALAQDSRPLHVGLFSFTQGSYRPGFCFGRPCGLGLSLVFSVPTWKQHGHCQLLLVDALARNVCVWESVVRASGFVTATGARRRSRIMKERCRGTLLLLPKCEDFVRGSLSHSIC